MWKYYRKCVDFFQHKACWFYTPKSTQMVPLCFNRFDISVDFWAQCWKMRFVLNLFNKAYSGVSKWLVTPIYTPLSTKQWRTKSTVGQISCFPILKAVTPPVPFASSKGALAHSMSHVATAKWHAAATQKTWHPCTVKDALTQAQKGKISQLHFMLFCETTPHPKLQL